MKKVKYTVMSSGTSSEMIFVKNTKRSKASPALLFLTSPKKKKRRIKTPHVYSISYYTSRCYRPLLCACLLFFFFFLMLCPPQACIAHDSQIIMNHFINNGFRGLSGMKRPLPCAYLARPHCGLCSAPHTEGAHWMRREITQLHTHTYTHAHTHSLTHTHTHTHIHTHTHTHTAPQLAAGKKKEKPQTWMTHSQNGSTYTVTSTTRLER